MKKENQSKKINITNEKLKLLLIPTLIIIGISLIILVIIVVLRKAIHASSNLIGITLSLTSLIFMYFFMNKIYPRLLKKEADLYLENLSKEDLIKSYNFDSTAFLLAALLLSITTIVAFLKLWSVSSLLVALASTVIPFLIACFFWFMFNKTNKKYNELRNKKIHKIK